LSPRILDKGMISELAFWLPSMNTSSETLVV
jgi:hypothetical protein